MLYLAFLGLIVVDLVFIVAIQRNRRSTRHNARLLFELLEEAES